MLLDHAIVAKRRVVQRKAVVAVQQVAKEALPLEAAGFRQVSVVSAVKTGRS